MQTRSKRIQVNNPEQQEQTTRQRINKEFESNIPSSFASPKESNKVKRNKR